MDRELASLSALVVAMDHNPIGGAYLVALKAMVMLSQALGKK
jgi:hypothetical protein